MVCTTTLEAEGSVCVSSSVPYRSGCGPVSFPVPCRPVGSPSGSRSCSTAASCAGCPSGASGLWWDCARATLRARGGARGAAQSRQLARAWGKASSRRPQRRAGARRIHQDPPSSGPSGERERSRGGSLKATAGLSHPTAGLVSHTGGVCVCVREGVSGKGPKWGARGKFPR